MCGAAKCVDGNMDEEKLLRLLAAGCWSHPVDEETTLRLCERGTKRLGAEHASTTENLRGQNEVRELHDDTQYTAHNVHCLGHFGALCLRRLAMAQRRPEERAANQAHRPCSSPRFERDDR